MIFRKGNLARDYDHYLARESLDKREKWTTISVIGGMVVTGNLEYMHTHLHLTNVDDLLTTGRDVAFSLVVGLAAVGVRTSCQQSAAKEYPERARKEFEGIAEALPDEPALSGELRLSELDRAFTELCGSDPVPTDY